MTGWPWFGWPAAETQDSVSLSRNGFQESASRDLCPVLACAVQRRRFPVGGTGFGCAGTSSSISRQLLEPHLFRPHGSAVNFNRRDLGDLRAWRARARSELKGSAKYTFVHLNGTKFRLTREVI